MQEYKNSFVYVRLYPKTDTEKPYIFFRDLTDVYNETSAYTQKIRGIEKGFKFIEQIFKDERLKDDLKFKFKPNSYAPERLQ